MFISQKIWLCIDIVPSPKSSNIKMALSAKWPPRTSSCCIVCVSYLYIYIYHDIPYNPTMVEQLHYIHISYIYTILIIFPFWWVNIQMYSEHLHVPGLLSLAGPSAKLLASVFGPASMSRVHPCPPNIKRCVHQKQNTCRYRKPIS